MARQFLLIFTLFQVLYSSSSIDYTLLDSYQASSSKNLGDLMEIPMETFYITPYSKFNDTVELVRLSENCTQAFERFTNSLLNFTNCSLTHSRPIHICMKCDAEHKVAAKNYGNLKNNQGSKCQEYFFSSDQLAIVDVLYNSAMQLWVKSSCQGCYDHLEETKTFFMSALDLQTCINQSSNLDKNGTCEECKSIYANLSASYHFFVDKTKEFEGGVCMDIIDTMNISRQAWSDLECIILFKSGLEFGGIVTALTFGFSPVLFYFLARHVARLDDIKLVRPKRKSVAVPVAESNPQ